MVIGRDEGTYDIKASHQIQWGRGCQGPYVAWNLSPLCRKPNSAGYNQR